MRGPFLLSVVAILTTAACPAAFATDLTVPGDHGTIAAALAAARSGDRVIVAPGTYREWGLVLGSGVTLAGATDDPADVVIDAEGRGRILACENNASAAAVANLTLTGGHAAGATVFESSGGAILCNYSDLRVDNCILAGNRADFNGGAVWVFEASPQFYGCRFVDNQAGGGGGAIDCTISSSPLVRDSWFEGNRADWGGAISCRDFSSPTVTSTVFVRNEAVGDLGYGGGVFSDLDSRPGLVLCTFAENSARFGGAVANLTGSGANLGRCTLVANVATVRGAGLYSNNATPSITACIVAFQEGEGIYSSGLTAPSLTLTNVYGNSGGDWTGGAAPATLGEGNLSVDPLFCIPDGQDVLAYNIDDTSPCHPDSNGGTNMGAWPAGCDTPLPLLVSFDAAWQGQHPVLSWQIPTGLSSEPRFRLTGARASAPAVEWDIPHRIEGVGLYAAEDAAPASGGDEALIFRLYLSYDGQEWSLLSETELAPLPAARGLRDLRAWPNPFNPRTSVSFELGRSARVRIAVYDLTGRLVKVLADREFPAGANTEPWLGDDEYGGRAASGAYIVLVEGAERKLAEKITLLK